eukprot:gene13638-46192_t
MGGDGARASRLASLRPFRRCARNSDAVTTHAYRNSSATSTQHARAAGAGGGGGGGAGGGAGTEEGVGRKVGRK